MKDGKKVVKVYICLFTCSATRAIHLEMVESLNTSVFIHCLRWFTGRRGVLSLIVNDNPQTIKAAARFMKKLIKTDEVRKYLEDWRIVTSSGGLVCHVLPDGVVF